jgi:hypothetical protein
VNQEAFLIVGTSIVLTMAFFLGGRDKSCAQRLFTNTNTEHKFISLEITETQTDTLTTNY